RYTKLVAAHRLGMKLSNGGSCLRWVFGSGSRRFSDHWLSSVGSPEAEGKGCPSSGWLMVRSP
ncbi:hypothetical protein KI387_019847, partial [Taxus chinensis]